MQECILLRIMDITAGSGSGFAFPTQTNDTSGLDAGRSHGGGERVRRRRSGNTLPRSGVPPEVASTLPEALDYPPTGSASQG